MSKQRPPEPVRVPKMIAHPSGFLERTGGTEIRIHHPENASDGSVDWKLTAELLGEQLASARDMAVVAQRKHAAELRAERQTSQDLRDMVKRDFEYTRAVLEWARGPLWRKLLHRHP